MICFFSRLYSSELRCFSTTKMNSRTAVVQRPPAGTLQEQRKFTSFLPPHFSRITHKQTYRLGDSQVHVLTQPLKPPLAPDIRLHMHAVENTDDTLTLIGALAPTGELLRQLDELDKQVSHIVLPSSSPEHYLFAPSMSKFYPDALVWTVPQFMEGAGVPLPGRKWLFREVESRGVLREIDPSSGEFPDSLGAATFSVPLFVESAIYIKKARAVVLSDTGLKLAADDPEYASANRFLAEAVGIWDEVGPITKAVLEKYPDEAKAWCRETLGFDFCNLLLSHGTAVVEISGRESFEKCMDFLLQD
jgi:hypothetical protein